MFKICWSTNLRNFLKEVSDLSEIFRPKNFKICLFLYQNVYY